MKRWQWAYYSGMILAVMLFVLGELIWLPDPLRLGSRFFWIDALDWIVYLLALIPLLWAAGAVMKKRSPVGKWAGFCIRAIVVCGILSAAAIIIVPKQLFVSGGALVLTWILVFVDLFLYERSRRMVPVRSLSCTAVTIFLLLLLFCPTPYMVTYPGLTMNMNRYAQAQGGSLHGEIVGVLVFERPAFPIDWMYARIFPHYTFDRMDKLGMSLGSYNQLVHSMKADANASGSAIAFQMLGKGKGITSHGVRITEVLKDGAAAGTLLPDDVMKAINGQTINSVQELTERMKSVVPGQKVEVAVLRGGKQMTFNIVTRASKDEPRQAVFGIQVSDVLQYDIPGTVTFHNYLLHEGGPSHGAMLTLELVDQLTPCGVTNGNRVAGTGTIEPRGVVGPVGGVEQKAYTVSREGTDVFFVPAENEAEARRGAPKLQIVPVHSLNDMLKWLKSHPKQDEALLCK